MFFNLGITNSTVTDPATGKTIGNSDVAGFCPFQDPNVRKAIMLGIDRLGFHQQDYMHEDKSSFIATLWPNSYWNNTNLTAYPYDADQANSLLDAAGYPVGADGIRAGTCDGKPVKFSLGLETTTAQFRIDDVLHIQSDLKKVGIDIKPNHYPGRHVLRLLQRRRRLADRQVRYGHLSPPAIYPDPDATRAGTASGVPNKDNPAGDERLSSLRS